jgi:hypothetical protein
MTEDPGPEFWARQHDQLVVIIEQPDRFTGLTTNGSGHVVIHLVDPAAAEQDRFRALLQDAQREKIEVELAQGLRPLRELNQTMERPNRIRLLVHDDVIVDASQG